MEQLHCRTMAQRVRCDAFACKARASSGCRQAMLAYQVLQSIPAEPLAPDRREQRAIAVAALADPALDQLSRIATKRRATCFSPLADAADVSAGTENHVPAAQVDQFGSP